MGRNAQSFDYFTSCTIDPDTGSLTRLSTLIESSLDTAVDHVIVGDRNVTLVLPITPAGVGNYLDGLEVHCLHPDTGKHRVLRRKAGAQWPPYTDQMQAGYVNGSLIVLPTLLNVIDASGMWVLDLEREEWTRLEMPEVLYSGRVLSFAPIHTIDTIGDSLALFSGSGLLSVSPNGVERHPITYCGPSVPKALFQHVTCSVGRYQCVFRHEATETGRVQSVYLYDTVSGAATHCESLPLAGSDTEAHTSAHVLSASMLNPTTMLVVQSEMGTYRTLLVGLDAELFEATWDLE
ncbi:hypothetical protein KIPB_007943 [Kipferlia bialata]|uniref:Uncharacterized protein n=1 Tax=Kipferlia bialata TaxID=797122 RepID=A0A9K3CZY6_9EUKA|nr:hypothetical protein KIPB_007943 [Kipferlia bialata]|eukprot:g7943.t1